MVLLEFLQSSFAFLGLWVTAYVWIKLLAYDKLIGVWRVELSRIMTAKNLHQQYKASSHFDHTLRIPSFTCISSPSNTAWVGFGTCDYCYVVDEIGT